MNEPAQSWSFTPDPESLDEELEEDGWRMELSERFFEEERLERYYTRKEL